jgi:nitrate reductase alpha subunit
MGWLPSAPQLNLNPLTVKAKAEQAGYLLHTLHRR